MTSISALILTRDETKNIARTIAALPGVEEVLLIDSFSTDDTVERARKAHAKVRVLEREFDSFAGQCNFGLSQVDADWVLSLDADYVLSPELSAEMAALNPNPNVVGYSVDFVYSIFGNPLRGSAYPPRTVLYRRDKARYVDEGHGHLVIIDGEIGKLCGKIYHDDRKPLSHWILAQDRYAKVEAKHLLSKQLRELNFQDRLRRKIFFAAPAMFLYLLFARGLILDGWPGWFYVAQRTIAELLLSMTLIVEREKLEDGS